jgi:uncharacterized protein with von Willebrand factor type A (vWA) domain
VTFRSGYVWRYVSLAGQHGCRPEVESLFQAMSEDLLSGGDVEKAMQKAFRWGYQDEDGEDIPGLLDLMQQLRDEREVLQEQAVDGREGRRSGSAAEEEGITRESEDDSGEAADLSGRIEQIAELERSLRQVESLDDLHGLEPRLVDSVLDDDQREWLEEWMAMTGRLIDAGLVIQGDRKLELSPEAIRRIGVHALRSMYMSFGHRGVGEHELHERGDRGPTTDTSSQWQFGQPFTLHLTRTILNAVHRSGSGQGLRLRPEDFEVFDRESTSATAAVLLIDMSRSMFHNGAWDAAKRSTLALDALMRAQFPRDVLEIVGFSESAVRLNLTQLPSLTWDEFSHGTNLQDGLALARRLLRPYGNRDRQIILVTDGEPTAFTEKGETIFENPATDRTFDATLREVVRCTRDRIGITTFLLSDAPELLDFVTRMTRINRGRVIQARPGQLGRYLVRDFQRHRSTVVG